MSAKKFLILPCSGIGKAVGTVGRWAAFELAEKLRQDDVQLLCLARLTMGDKESKEILKNHPSITIDGCPKKCSKVNVERNGSNVIKSYTMSKFLAKNRDLKIGTNILDPGEDAIEMAKRIAQEISADIDKFKEESKYVGKT